MARPLSVAAVLVVTPRSPAGAEREARLAWLHDQAAPPGGAAPQTDSGESARPSGPAGSS
jgi:hypothetical protein